MSDMVECKRIPCTHMTIQPSDDSKKPAYPTLLTAAIVVTFLQSSCTDEQSQEQSYDIEQAPLRTMGVIAPSYKYHPHDHQAEQ